MDLTKTTKNISEREITENDLFHQDLFKNDSKIIIGIHPCVVVQPSLRTQRDVFQNESKLMRGAQIISPDHKVAIKRNTTTWGATPREGTSALH